MFYDRAHFVGNVLHADRNRSDGFGLATRATPMCIPKSLGIDANFWWGLVLLVFGVGLLFLGRHGRRASTGSRASQHRQPEALQRKSRSRDPSARSLRSQDPLSRFSHSAVAAEPHRTVVESVAVSWSRPSMPSTP